MATFAASTDIQNRIENLDGSLTTAILEDFIEQAEYLIRAITGVDFTSGFDVAKHGLFHTASICWASMSAIIYNPAGFTDISESTLMLDVLSFQWDQCLLQMKDKSVIEYLQGL